MLGLGIIFCRLQQLCLTFWCHLQEYMLCIVSFLILVGTDHNRTSSTSQDSGLRLSSMTIVNIASSPPNHFFYCLSRPDFATDHCFPICCSCLISAIVLADICHRLRCLDGTKNVGHTFCNDPEQIIGHRCAMRKVLTLVIANLISPHGKLGMKLLHGQSWIFE